ncbi:hypothetical protein imdm_2023 [gamma proteobacterium IMCC2047]|nr:hypothetical protein imdm_2023 [gamma proteobacterium IMCC2047]
MTLYRLAQTLPLSKRRKVYLNLIKPKLGWLSTHAKDQAQFQIIIDRIYLDLVVDPRERQSVKRSLYDAHRNNKNYHRGN